MYFKKLIHFYVMSLIFLSSSLCAMEREERPRGIQRTLGVPDEDELRKKKSFVIGNLTPYQRSKLDRFLSDPYTNGPVSLFLDYFDMCYPDYCDPINRLGEVLDLVSEETDLGENSRLVFFTPEIFKVYIPPTTSEFTESMRQFAVSKYVGHTLCILRDLQPNEFVEVLSYFTSTPHARSSACIIIDLLRWYKILPPGSRIPTFNQMLSTFNLWPTYDTSLFRAHGVLYQHLAEISSLERRRQILTLVLSGLSNHLDLKDAYVKRVVPVLAKLTPEEFTAIKQYFTPETIGISKEKRIFLQILERLIRRVDSRSIKSKIFSDKVFLVNHYVECSPEERLHAMSTLIPDYLRKCPPQNFFTLVEDMYARTPEYSNFTEILMAMVRGEIEGPTDEIVCSAPIRWYPLLKLALTYTESEFNTLLKSPCKPVCLEEMSRDELDFMHHEFPYDSEFRSIMPEVIHFRSLFLGNLRMNTRQSLLFNALLFYETSPFLFPRLRSVPEVEALMSHLKSIDQNSFTSAEEFLDYLKSLRYNGKSFIIQNILLLLRYP